MEQATHALAPSGSQFVLPASVTLAFQRMRYTWRMLCLVGLGMLASVTVVCAVPLYSQVAMTAGLRTILTSSSQSADIVVSGSSYRFSQNDLDSVTGLLNQEFQRHLGAYLLPEQFSLHTSPFPIMATNPSGSLAPTGDLMNMIGTDTTRALPHVHLVQGRLPSTTVVGGNTIEIALREEIANGWKPGSIIPVLMGYNDGEHTLQSTKAFYLHVVGVFTFPKTDDPFWHGESFLGYNANAFAFVNSSLVSNTALVSLLNQLEPDPASGLTANVFNGLSWYYTLNAAQISIGQLDSILNGVKTIQQDNANSSGLISQSGEFQHITTYMSTAALQLYHDRLPVMQFPILSLTLFVLALILFFMTLMTGILVERQVGALALLRSRGASSRQIFWSMVTQALVLGLIALVVGPLLTISVVRLLAEHILTAIDQSALNVISGSPVPIVLDIGLYALVTVGAMVLAMILSIWGVSNRDVLALRRETARSTHRPFWQRLNLDVMAVVIALLGVGFSLYLSNSNVLDSRARLLFLSPLALLAAVCTLLAALLILLRGFPWLLRGGSWLATRLRGAASQIALAQMSRAPRQSMRLTLLLALATAFTIFTLVFNASQTQRIQDVSDYQAVADFSGSLQSGVLTPQQIANATHSYAHLPGVLSTSLGYARTVNAGTTSLNLPIDFKAVDSTTFGQTARWSSQDSEQTLPVLMHLLASARFADAVPAIVDAATGNELHLALGAHFALNFSVVGNDDLVQFKVVAEVQHIPTSNDTATPGVLADYQSFAKAYMHNYSTSGGFESPVNYIWLRTSDNAQQLTTLRGILSTSLTSIHDRRQIVAQLSNEPLYLTLFGILLLGTTTALLLALIGNLVASWLNASARLANFAALRALGASPGQIAGTLAWEQVIIYSTALVLGFFFGWLFSLLVLPSLVFTSILPSQVSGNVDNQVFYAAQNTPPIQIVIPAALWIALGALIVLCIIALGMMVRIVSRPSIAQVLRLNED